MRRWWDRPAQQTLGSRPHCPRWSRALSAAYPLPLGSLLPRQARKSNVGLTTRVCSICSADSQMLCLRSTWISPGSSFSSKALTSFLLRDSGLPSARAYVSKVFIRMAMAVSSCDMVAGVVWLPSRDCAQVPGRVEEGVEAHRRKYFYTPGERDRFHRSGDCVFYQGCGLNCVNTAANMYCPECFVFRSGLSFSRWTVDSRGVFILTCFQQQRQQSLWFAPLFGGRTHVLPLYLFYVFIVFAERRQKSDFRPTWNNR